MVWLGGAGIASFHPQASARATLGVESRRGRAMAVFICSGTLGLSIGPTYFSVISSRWGLSHTHWAALPGVLITVLLVSSLPSVPRRYPQARRSFDWEPLRVVWKPLTILYFLVFIRSILQITFAQFLPLYLHLERGYLVTHANYSLSLYLGAGATGGFIGGHLADRFGGRLVILLSMIFSVPFLVLFFFARGPLSLAGLAAGGFILMFTIPVNVVMAQELVPSQAGTVSALMMGFAWGMAGLVFIPLTGWASDLFSLHQVMMSLLVFPVIGFFLALRLPK
jgi:FSR family fosmidomycin resistance protein-like MFS transporter